MKSAVSHQGRAAFNGYPRSIKLLAASSKCYQMARGSCPVVDAGEMLAQF